MVKKPALKSVISRMLILCGVLLLLTAGGLIWSENFVNAESGLVSAQPSPLHPSFPLLDSDGNHVLTSGKAVSTMQTCGDCHDTNFIVDHSYHASAGLDEIRSAGETVSGRAWDISPGYFGSWNPLEYRYLSPAQDSYLDLTTPEWLQVYGIRHVGGGPAVYSQNGTPLVELPYSPQNPETNIIDPETGELTPWDWTESGVIEMNCFLCHSPAPNNQARIAAIQAGEFGWANTATLVGTGIVEENNGAFEWNPEVFNQDGTLQEEYVAIQDPENTNCGLCHGLVHDNVEDPLVTLGCSPDRWSTITTGQIISPQKMADSGMNLADKESLSRAWDVHAERLLNCTDCHYSINNPLYYQESELTKPDHLLFDPRRVEIGEYLQKPLHQFARGNSAQNLAADDLNYTMRGCEDCHDPGPTHQWLPYLKSHLAALSCESCHIPKLFSSANMLHDWTVLQQDSSARKECRGTEQGNLGGMESLLTGYQPVLITSPDGSGGDYLAPHNLITTWFWVYDDPPRPVRLSDLEAAYFENGDYHPGVLDRFDSNQDGEIDTDELTLDSDAKEQFIRDRLTRLGLANPRITGEIQAYSIHHDVAASNWSLKDCTACHTRNSRLAQPLQLASYSPGDVVPEFIGGSDRTFTGEVVKTDSGAVVYQPDPAQDDLYIFGRDSVRWIDLGGGLLFLAVVLGVSVHGGLRIYNTRGRTQPDHPTEKVYMYGGYERFWHWLQTAAILLLLLTGLAIHKPDSFGFLDFRGVVLVHNVVAVILGLNAGLALFYHLASGEIKQYIPRPQGFFDRSVSQALYYLQGIFKGEAHPFEKTPQKKLNPLQQLTYFGLLNILLPLQGISGVLMWGVQRWPNIAGWFGGLPFLAPFHTLIAWLFAAFIVLHVYLTTTGHKPLSAIEAMIVGWEEMEIHSHSDEQDH